MANAHDRVNQAEQGEPLAHTLIEELRSELKTNNGQWARLSRISDGSLTYPWIQQFANGEIDMPSLEKAAALAKYLGFRIKVEQGQHYNRFSG
jgi:hypothetical protein